MNRDTEQTEALAWQQLSETMARLDTLSTAGQQLAGLLGAELRLAAGDLKRILWLSVFLLPLAMLAWIGLSVFLCWLAYSLTAWPWLGFLLFPLLQLTLYAVLCWRIRCYRESLKLPETRRHLSQLMEEGV